MRKILFICLADRIRSRTAAHFLQSPEINTRYGGVDKDAGKIIDECDLKWADEIYCFEQFHYTLLAKIFPDKLKDKFVGYFSIPDRYDYGDPTLIRQIKFNMGMFDYSREDFFAEQKRTRSALEMYTSGKDLIFS